MQSIDVEFGATVKSGQVVVTLVRDPLPRATLNLTEDLLKPVSANLHGIIAEYRRAVTSAAILKMEFERLSTYDKVENGLPLLPEKEILQVKYDLMKAENELAITQNELEQHGLNELQITEIHKGRMPIIDVNVWLEALKHNGFWSKNAQEIYDVLPKSLKMLPWTVATIAELVAADLAEAEFTAWIKNDPRVGRHFLEIGGLLQRGHNLEDVKDLYRMRALEPVVKVLADASAPDWDVHAIHVTPGKNVEKGDPLVTLVNPRRLYLSGEPSDGEVGLVVKNMKNKTKVTAHPLVAGSGPVLRDLSLTKLLDREDAHSAAVYVPFLNVPLLHENNFRSWEVREGQRYELRVPLKNYEKVYVFPTGTVVDDGPDQVLFFKSGDSFKSVKVEILYQDHEVVVVPGTTSIFPGNPIVTQGAFALKMATQTDSASQGHGHSHGPGCGHSH